MLVGIVVVLAACGSSRRRARRRQHQRAARVEPTLGHGVTAKEFKLGVSLSDFNCIQQFVDKHPRRTKKQNYNVYIDDVNAKGGINGPQDRPGVPQVLPDPDARRAREVCTQFTEDDKVVRGLRQLLRPAGRRADVLAKQHKTPLMAFMLTAGDHRQVATRG